MPKIRVFKALFTWKLQPICKAILLKKIGGKLKMSADTLSIKEVAEIVGISTQAIYQRLDKDLKNYLIIENGKKRLKTSVMSDVFDKNSKPTCKESSIHPDKGIIDFFQAQLQEKDTQLRSKDTQLQEKDDQIKQLLQALHNSQTLLKQNQDILKLTAGAEAVTTDPPETTDTEDVESESVPETPKKQEKSRGFFSWFKK